MPEVVLRDFDGAETLVMHDAPLPEIIHTEQTDPLGPVFRHYLRSREADGEGRPVYLESNL
ncbi:MAG: hypothetical protein LAO79_19195 [Acidobacteriia bacterium]|nr:hypothetical protein [Terriglobia bacterium]